MTLFGVLKRLGRNNVRIERREGGNEIGGYTELHFLRIDNVCFVMAKRYRHFYRSKIFLDQFRNYKKSSSSNFLVNSQNFVMCFFLSVRPYGTTWLPLDGVSLTFWRRNYFFYFSTPSV